MNTCTDCGRQYDKSKVRTNHCTKCKYDRQKAKWKCSDCGKPISPRSIRCRKCDGKAKMYENHPGWTGGKRKTSQGYVILTDAESKAHPNAQTGGLLEHIRVMSEFLGRPLVSGENVHHRNGTKDDNRLENLELWSTSQPYGQRVVDKIQWAREILAQYESEVERLSTHS